jgi:hypothetical protein
VAPASLAPAAGKIEGTLEIAAPPGMTIAVDGIERGTGPHLSLPLAPGYHMVRVGSTITQLVQVHTKAVASVDLSARR